MSVVKFHHHHIHAAIFDMDGTLLDTERLRHEILKQTSLELFGFEFSHEYLIGCLGLNETSTMQLTQKFYGEDFPYWQMRKRAEEIEKDYISKQGIAVKAGVIETLDYLKSKNIQVAVATSSHRKGAEQNLKTAHIYDYFDLLVCGDEITQGKPHPEIFSKASTLFNIDPQNCLMVEDSENGITSARHAEGITILIEDLKVPNDNMLAMADYDFTSMQGMYETLVEFN